MKGVIEMDKMFCWQCEQTAQGKGCTVAGVCGKDSSVAALQDLLVYVITGVAVYGKLAREQVGVKDLKADEVIIEGLFTTVTNVNFDADKIVELIKNAYVQREKIKRTFLEQYKVNNGKDYDGVLPTVATFTLADSLDELIKQGAGVGIMADPDLNEDIRSLRELLLYGLKGMASYADHAAILGEKDNIDILDLDNSTPKVFIHAKCYRESKKND